MEIRNSEFTAMPNDFMRNSQRSKTSSTSYLVDSHADKSAYKKDKACAVCGVNFGIIGMTQKHNCKFCYRGVCWKCSLQQAIHPETNEMVRICERCHSNSIQSKVNKEFEGDLIDIKAEIKVLKEKLQNEIRATRSEKLIKTGIKSNLHETIDANKESEKELQQKISDAKLNNMEIENENKRISDNIKELMNNEEEIDADLFLIQSKFEEGLTELKSYKAKIDEIKDLTTKQLIANEKKRATAKKAEKIRDSSNVERLRKENEEVERKQRIEKAKKEIDEVKRMNTRLIHKIQELQENEDTEEEIRKSLDGSNLLPDRNSINPRVGDPYKLLRDQQKSQIEEISNLQFEIKNVKNMSAFYGKESVRDPLERDQCKCIIQ